MDINEAKFILQSFRPDGSDCDAPDFQEALKLSLEDRELGEWLVQERAADSSFAEALSSACVPEGLRENILASMAAEIGEPGAIFDSFDQEFSSALNDVPVPAGLREQILSSAKQTVITMPTPVKRSSPNVFARWVAPLAAAAAIAIAFIYSQMPKKFYQEAPLAVTQVQHSFDDMFGPFMRLDKKSESEQELTRWVETQNLPIGRVAPAALKELAGVGCKELDFGGKTGSLVCLRTDEGEMVHLVVFKKEDVAEQLPSIENVQLASTENWNVAQWECPTNAHFLFGDASKVSKEELARFF